MKKNSTFSFFIQDKPYFPLEIRLPHLKKFIKTYDESEVSFFIATAYSLLPSLKKSLNSKTTFFGLNTLFPVERGSFCESIAIKMIVDSKAEFITIGSVDERKLNTGSQGALIAKIKMALASEVTPIICVSDTFQDFEEGVSEKKLIEQLKEINEGLTLKERKKLTIIYDATWIVEGLWKAEESILLKAYENFKSALTQTMTPSIQPTLNLGVAVPVDSPELKEILSLIKEERFGFSWAFFGTLKANP